MSHKSVEREIDRLSRGRKIRSDSNRRQRPSTGARAEHDRRVATRRGTLPSPGEMLGRIGPGIKRDSDYGSGEVRKKMENRKKR